MGTHPIFESDFDCLTDWPMAEHGAQLQTYNNELVKCIEDLCAKRDEVSKEIKIDEGEKEKLEHDIAILHERLQKVNAQLAKKIQVRAHNRRDGRRLHKDSGDLADFAQQRQTSNDERQRESHPEELQMKMASITNPFRFFLLTEQLFPVCIFAQNFLPRNFT